MGENSSSTPNDTLSAYADFPRVPEDGDLEAWTHFFSQFFDIPNQAFLKAIGASRGSRANWSDVKTWNEKLTRLAVEASGEPRIKGMARQLLLEIEASLGDAWLRWRGAAWDWRIPGLPGVTTGHLPDFRAAILACDPFSVESPALAAVGRLLGKGIQAPRLQNFSVRDANVPESLYANDGWAEAAHVSRKTPLWLALPLLGFLYHGQQTRIIPPRYFWSLPLAQWEERIAPRWAFYYWTQPHQTAGMLSEVERYEFASDVRLPPAPVHWFRRLAAGDPSQASLIEHIARDLGQGSILSGDELSALVVEADGDLTGIQGNSARNPDHVPLLWAMNAALNIVDRHQQLLAADRSLYEDCNPALVRLLERLWLLQEWDPKISLSDPLRMRDTEWRSSGQFLARTLFAVDAEQPHGPVNWLRWVADRAYVDDHDLQQTKDSVQLDLRSCAIRSPEAVGAILLETQRIVADALREKRSPRPKLEPQLWAIDTGVYWIIQSVSLLPWGLDRVKLRAFLKRLAADLGNLEDQADTTYPNRHFPNLHPFLHRPPADAAQAFGSRRSSEAIADLAAKV